MYKPRKYQRQDLIRHFPKLDDLKKLSADAYRARGCVIELPWHSAKTTIVYTLSVIVELAGNDTLWTLCVGEGEATRVLWSTPTNDLEMLMDVMTLSLPDEVEKAQIPADLAFGAPIHPSAVPPPGFMQAAPPGYQYPPGYQAPAPNYPYPPGYYPPPPGYPPNYQYPPGYQVPLPPGYPPGPWAQAPYPSGGAAGQHPGAMRTTGPYAVPYPAPYPVAAPQPVAQPHSVPTPNPTGSALAQVPVAATLPVQQGPPAVSEPAAFSPAASSGGDGAPKKRANIMLGQFLVLADLIPQSTLDAALLLQEMVKNGVFDMTQAAETLIKAHNRGGALDQATFTARSTEIEKVHQAPPLGQLLLKAGLIDGGALTAALKFQQAARTGHLQREQALEAFTKETFGKSRPGAVDGPELERTLQLLTRSGLVSDQDVQAARKLKEKHSGSLMNILSTAGKIDSKTIDAAAKIQTLVDQKRLKDEQAIIALLYCQRSRVTFDEAIDELGWPKP